MTKYKLVVMALMAVVLGACTKTEAPIVETKKTPTEVPSPVVKLAVWKDEAGFNFSYPENIKVVADTKDNESYANLTTDDGVKIMAVDSKYKDVAAWVKGEAKFKDGLIIDTELSGKSGKKVVKDGITTVGIIDDNILFSLEIPANTKSGGQIIDSFTLTYPTPKQTTKVNQAPEEEAVLEEEVVE